MSFSRDEMELYTGAKLTTKGIRYKWPWNSPNRSMDRPFSGSDMLKRSGGLPPIHLSEIHMLMWNVNTQGYPPASGYDGHGNRSPNHYTWKLPCWQDKIVRLQKPSFSSCSLIQTWFIGSYAGFLFVFFYIPGWWSLLEHFLLFHILGMSLECHHPNWLSYFSER